jgi:hypothetical protein
VPSTQQPLQTIGLQPDMLHMQTGTQFPPWQVIPEDGI